jgi:hypothetical protein
MFRVTPSDPGRPSAEIVFDDVPINVWRGMRHGGRRRG